MFTKKEAQEIYEKINNKKREINEYENEIEHKLILKEKFSKDEIIEYITRKEHGEALYGFNWDLDPSSVNKAFNNIKQMMYLLGE